MELPVPKNIELPKPEHLGPVAGITDCEWKERVDSTVARIKKEAEANGETEEVTNRKIEAVRNHDRKNGKFAVVNIGTDENKVLKGIVIKK